MNKYEHYTRLLDIANNLAQSTGFYGRLYDTLITLDDEQKQLLDDDLKAHNCKSDLDYILYVEE